MMMTSSITGRARRYFERVETEEPYAAAHVERQRPTNIIDDNNDDVDDDVEQNGDGNGDEVATTTTTTTTTATEIPLATAVDDDDDDEEELEQEQEQPEQEQEQEDEEETLQMYYTSIEELELARDEAIQQSSTCIMTGSYILMMLWLQVFTTYDMSLFLISLLLSSMFVRYIEYAQQNVDTLNQLVITFNNENGTTTRSRNGRRTSGVDEIVKQHWDKFTFNSRASLAKKENFGTTTSRSLFTIDVDDDDDDDDDDEDYDYDDKLKKMDLDDDDTPSYQHEHHQQQHHHEDTDTDHPECSICLGEYEMGDKLVSLNPCHHIFHEECITSWTNHNTRCPLCNIDLVQEIQIKVVVVVDDDDDFDDMV